MKSSKLKITPTQRRLIEEIISYKKKNGHPPTWPDLATEMGITGVGHLVRPLRDAGILAKDKLDIIVLPKEMMVEKPEISVETIVSHEGRAKELHLEGRSLMEIAQTLKEETGEKVNLSTIDKWTRNLKRVESVTEFVKEEVEPEVVEAPEAPIVPTTGITEDVIGRALITKMFEMKDTTTLLEKKLFDSETELEQVQAMLKEFEEDNKELNKVLQLSPEDRKKIIDYLNHYGIEVIPEQHKEVSAQTVEKLMA